MNVKDQLKWCSEELLPSIIKNGSFAEKGENQTLKSCEFELPENYVSSFASAPSFAKLKLSSLLGTVSRHVLVKFQCPHPLYREKMRTEPQYANEVKFYNHVMPCFREFLKISGQSPEFIDKIVPKCYYAWNGDREPEKAVIILEDLRSLGFRLSDSVTNLNLQHCFVALERLARFHALSFAMKFKKWQPFEELKTVFEDVWLTDHPICRQKNEDFCGNVCQRGIEYLLKQKDSEVPRDYLEKLRDILKPIFEYMRSVKVPKEPLSVITHGDFNRNNILYRYENGEVVDAKLIDYQQVSYGSPSLDLGLFVYLNTTLQFREKHFDEIFQYYYSHLVKSISSITSESEKTINDWIPIEAFKEDFERAALFNYITASFFLPIMMTPPDTDFEHKIKYQTFREMAEENYEKGGEEISKRISEVLLDFYRRNFYK